MRRAHPLVSTNQRRQRYAFRRGECCVPARAVLHRAYFLAVFVHVFPCRFVAHELLASDRVLAFRETLEVFLTHFTLEAPLLGTPSMPLTANHIALRVVVLAGVAELFRVIRLSLARTQRVGDSQHVLAYSKKCSWLDSVRASWWSRVCFTSCCVSFCLGVSVVPTAAATVFGGASVRILIGRSTYFGCLPGSSRKGKLIRTTRFSFLR